MKKNWLRRGLSVLREVVDDEIVEIRMEENWRGRENKSLEKKWKKAIREYLRVYEVDEGVWSAPDLAKAEPQYKVKFWRSGSTFLEVKMFENGVFKCSKNVLAQFYKTLFSLYYYGLCLLL